MRIFILDTYYSNFLDKFWETHSAENYASTWQTLMNECFGTADYYSHNLKNLGHEATEVVANDLTMQSLWAREHDLKLPRDAIRYRPGRHKRWIPCVRREMSRHWIYPVLDAQIEAFAPDVLYVQDINFTRAAWLREVKKRGILVAGQVACPLEQRDYSAYDVIFTSLPGFIEILRQRGARARLFRIGFESRVLDKLGAAPAAPPHAVGFGGGISAAHSQRGQFLETIARRVPLDVWGYGAETLPPDSPLSARHHGEAWGLEMYRALQSCAIAINGHLNLAGPDANNMRLYETTGVGTLLLTDNKRNLGEIFDLDREIVAYENADDCLEKIEFLLDNPAKRAQIARAGQARTLRDHSYARRMEELSALLSEELARRA